MNLLAFETSTPTGGVALIKDDVVVGSTVITNSRAHSQICLPAAESLLEHSQMKWHDLDILACSIGPGSFTGVRVGASLVKSLCYSLAKPAVAVSTLEAMALNSYRGEDVGALVPLIDARVGEVYASIYQRGNEGHWESSSRELCISPEELVEVLPNNCLFCGEGARVYYESHFSSKGILAKPEALLSSPVSVAALALAKARNGEQIESQKIELVYLREPVARPKNP